jgi:hypothetical protein
MTKPTLTCLVLAFALSAAAAAAAVAPLSVPVPAPALDSLLAAPASAAGCPAAVTPGVPRTSPEWLEMSCCISRCSRDRDCTAFCGGPGQCIQVNSCCRECACFQT